VQPVLALIEDDRAWAVEYIGLFAAMHRQAVHHERVLAHSCTFGVAGAWAPLLTEIDSVLLRADESWLVADAGRAPD
jgi:hypothetical protein